MVPDPVEDPEPPVVPEPEPEPPVVPDPVEDPEPPVVPEPEPEPPVVPDPVEDVTPPPDVGDPPGVCDDDDDDDDGHGRGHGPGHGHGSTAPDTPPGDGDCDDDDDDDDDDLDDWDEPELEDSGFLDDDCTRTQGWYSTHNPEAAQAHRQVSWPIPADTELCGATWLDAISGPTQGDAWKILAKQWVAAANNAVVASAPSDVLEGLVFGESLLAECEIDAQDRDLAIGLSELLAAYNEGEIGPGHCDD